MPAIADQVAALEHDHDDALAKIDALNATVAAQLDAINAITAKKASLEAKVAELSDHIDGLTVMAENVANGALNMLKATRLPKGTPVAVIPYAPITAIERLRAAGTVNGQATEKAPDAPTVQNTVAARVSRVLITDDMLKPEPARPAAPEPTAGDALLTPTQPGLPELMAPPTADSLTSAVDRIKRHFLPPVTLMRRPAAPGTPAGCRCSCDATRSSPV
jgi:hypothetical protein